MRDVAHHDLVRSQQREVTLLFADLRGFTELAAGLEMDPLVCELLGHVMDCLTTAVAVHDGFVVDYFGDGLMAMWNAPGEQSEHPELACSAALAMLETLPAVAEDWAGVTQAELRLGIGVHTGTVQVGNAGSKRQAKYGPRGPNVHLASRVETATKTLGQPLLATAATAQRLSDRFAANRICRARLPGLGQPTDLSAIRWSTNDTHLSAAWKSYDEALQHFELGRLQQAAETLATFEGCGLHIPWRFLAGEVQRELGRHQRRRSTDRERASGGVIAVKAK